MKKNLLISMFLIFGAQWTTLPMKKLVQAAYEHTTSDEKNVIEFMTGLLNSKQHENCQDQLDGIQELFATNTEKFVALRTLRKSSTTAQSVQNPNKNDRSSGNEPIKKRKQPDTKDSQPIKKRIILRMLTEVSISIEDDNKPIAEKKPNIRNHALHTLEYVKKMGKNNRCQQCIKCFHAYEKLLIPECPVCGYTSQVSYKLHAQNTARHFIESHVKQSTNLSRTYHCFIETGHAVTNQTYGTFAERQKVKKRKDPDYFPTKS